MSRVDLVITDQAMPGMTGTQLIGGNPPRAPRPADPARDRLRRTPERRDTKVPRLNKPFLQAHLAQAIGEVMRGRRTQRILVCCEALGRGARCYALFGRSSWFTAPADFALGNRREPPLIRAFAFFNARSCFLGISICAVPSSVKELSPFPLLKDQRPSKPCFAKNVKFS